ncbi:MAG: hypothetical protein WBA93_26555 [Microcoleaceae cyanobacterium]
MTQTHKIIDNTWLERSSPKVAPHLVGWTLVQRISDDQIIRWPWEAWPLLKKAVCN